MAGQFYQSPTQLQYQMTDSAGNSKSEFYAGESSYSNDPSESTNDQIRRPASVEDTSNTQFQQANVRPCASDTKLNDN